MFKKHTLMDLSHSKNISSGEYNNGIYLTDDSLELNYINNSPMKFLKRRKDESIILKNIDQINPLIIYGEAEGINISGANKYSPKDAIDLPKKLISIPPSTLVFPEKSHVLSLNFQEPYIQNNKYKVKGYTDTNLILLKSQVYSKKHYDLRDTRAGGSQHRVGFIRAHRDYERPNHSLIYINSLKDYESPYIIKFSDINLLSYNDCKSAIYQFQIVMNQMRRFYENKLLLSESSDDFKILDGSLKRSFYRFKRTLIRYNPKYFENNKLKPLKSVNVRSDSSVSQKSNTIKDIPFNDRAQSIIDDYKSYSIDLVKMMSNPLMIDISIPIIDQLDLLCEKYALRIEHGCILSEDEYLALSRGFKKAILLSETNKLSLLDKDKKTKLKDAQQMFNKAIHENTQNSEKVTALKGMFLKLEGVLPINEKTIDWVKEKTGVLEIEM